MRILRAIIAIMLVMSLTIDVQATERRRRIVTGCQLGNQVPQRISGLVRWYNAADQGYASLDKITVWTDSSPTHANAIQSDSDFAPTAFIDPYFNNVPVAQFNGADNELSFSSITLTNFTIFWMSSHNDLSISQSTIIGREASAFGSVRQLSNTTTGVVFNGGLSKTYTHADISSETPSLHVLTSDHRHWLGGVASSVAGLDSNTVTFDLIGNTGAGPPSSGFIGEIGIYNRVITDAQINEIGAYLAAKYALTWSPI